jgi:hypothetical protein
MPLPPHLLCPRRLSQPGAVAHSSSRARALCPCASCSKCTAPPSFAAYHRSKLP